MVAECKTDDDTRKQMINGMVTYICVSTQYHIMKANIIKFHALLAVPWLGQLLVDLLPQSLWFNPSPAQARPGEIFGGQGGTKTGFTPSTSL
jgi:hypothetical protein